MTIFRTALAVLCLAFVAMPAWAALSLTHAGWGGSTGSPPPNLTAPDASSVGDVIAISIQLTNGSTNTATVSDNLNGSYTAIGTPLRDVTNAWWTQWFWVRVTTAGTPVISVSLGTAVSGRIVYTRITGFTGTATLDSGMTGNYQSASGTAVNFALPNTAFNNEAVLLSWKSGSALTATPSGWTNDSYEYSMIAATSGTSAAFNGTLNASSFVNSQAIGIYDSTGSTARRSQFFFGSIPYAPATIGDRFRQPQRRESPRRVQALLPTYRHRPQARAA